MDFSEDRKAFIEMIVDDNLNPLRVISKDGKGRVIISTHYRTNTKYGWIREAQYELEDGNLRMIDEVSLL